MKKTINRNYFIIIYSFALTAVLVFMLMFTNSAVGVTQTNPSLSAEFLTEQLGETLEVTVNAYGTNTQKCFTLTFNSKNAGLSEEYIFNDEQTEITDNNGKKLILNREIGGDEAVNYWFELSEGEITNFTLNCTSGVYVVTVHDIEDFKSNMPQDETDEHGKISDEEIVELIKSQKASENQDADTATLRISTGGGTDLNHAKAETVKNDVLELNWNKEPEISLFSVSNKEEYIDGGEIEGTSLTWAYTKKRTATKGTLTISGTGAMPNYSSEKDTPWYKYRSKVNKIVIEDEVTYLGTRCFYSMGANELSLGKGITDISADYIFPGNNFKILKIPGTVKSVTGFGAFNNCYIEKVIFEEGVEKVNGRFCWSFGNGGINEIYIPKTVTSFTPSNYNVQTKKYIVDEENELYYTIDDILYKYNTAGTTSTLVSYPGLKTNIEYTLPDFVNTVESYAIYQVGGLNKITIHDNVSFGTRCINGCTNLKEITFGENCICTAFGFLSDCSSLLSLHFPDDFFKNSSWGYLVSKLTSLEEFNYPKGTKSIKSLGDCVIYRKVTPNLKKLYYDVEDSTAFNTVEVSPDYELIIQENVNRLRSGFQNVSNRSDKVNFIGNNQITIDEDAFINKSEPLNTLVGTVYVDEQGIVYKYDKETLTASVAYVPYGLETAIIPETITPETDVTCTITSVDKYSCKLAEDLKSITFAKPENITSIDVYGFADCTKLASVNGKTTEEEAAASFTNENIKIGYRAFINTALGGVSGGGSFTENMNGQQNLVVTKENVQPMYINLANSGDTSYMTWENGGYRTLTGNTVSANISVGNTEQALNNVYRVYFEKSEYDCSMSISPGETLVINGTTVTCYATEAPDIMYIDFIPEIGNTATISVDSIYTSPSSRGGGLKVWGKILTAEEAEIHRNDILEYTETTDSETSQTSSDTIQVYWTTQPDDFTLTKASSGNTAIRLIGDGNGNISSESNISYSITLARTSTETSEYGKDYVRTVDFYDCVTLPEKVQWKDEVIQAVKDGNTRILSSWLYAGDIKLMSASSVYGLSAEWSEEKQSIVFHWKSYNSSITAEIGKISSTFTISKDAVETNPNVLDDVAGTQYIIHNDVSADIHYTYSSDQTKTASAEKYFLLSDAEPKLSKTQSKSTYYFGEDVTYTLNFYNNGAVRYQSPDGNYTLTDTLPDVVYIAPQNMDKMFNDTYGKYLTLKITNAKLCTETSQVTAEDNGTAYTNYANSDVNTDNVITDTLTIVWNNDKLTIIKSDDTTVEVSESLEKTLSEMGYYSELGTKFNVTWKLNEGQNNVTLNGGEKQYYYIYATFMDTFKLLDKDRPNSYTQDLNNRYNQAYIYTDKSKKPVLSSGVYSQLKREAYISKSAYNSVTGEYIDSIDSVSLGDVLEYNLEFTHYGSGDYKDMPMTDDMYGIQALLVPVELNTSLADKNLDTTTLTENDISTDYYILSKTGTYKNIAVGTDDNGTVMIADTVTVTAASSSTDVTIGDNGYSYSGLHTEIKWYFSDLSEDNDYYISTSYYAMVSKSLLTSSNYTIGNTVWMNDRTGKRIYDVLWGGGSTLSSDKEIVTKNSDGTYTADDDDYSVISNGDSIYYRLTLSNPNDYTFTVSGSDITDELPMTSDYFVWTKNINVSLEYDENQTSTVLGLDDWSITDTRLGISQPGQYYISWPSTASISIPANDEFVMYVKLDFPDYEENSEIWTNYCDDVKGSKLYNTLYVYEYPSTVYHTLRDKGKVLLQKGVYSTNYYSGNSYYETSGRTYYNNRDSSNRAIAYYIVLYNDGNNRLYIDDIYDKLPKGFTFKSMINSGAYSKSSYTSVSSVSTKDSTNISSYPLVQTNINDISYLNATVSCTADGQNLYFRISSGSGNYAIKYDDQEKKYYLERGEALVFGYLCDIGVTANTEDYAKNTAIMKYYDYIGAGAAVISSDKVSITGKNTELYYDNNDGTRSMKDYTEIRDNFESLPDGQYLVSDVSVIRGGIVPGITSYTDSYVNEGSTLKIPYKSSVGPNATINWRARMHNSGELSIMDYTFIDNFPSPYGLTGSMSLNIFDTNGRTIRTFNNFLTVNNREKGDTEISVTSNNGSTYTLNTDGTLVTMSIKDTSNTSFNITVSLERINDTETLKINFEKSSFAIPENGGYADITLSGKNFTNVYNNTVYTNYTTIVPNSQTYDSAAQGSLIKNEDKVEGVINNSPVNISFGYSTTSVKKVEEIGISENAKLSTDENPYIILPNSNTEFKYTLSVNNDTDNSMTKLILIDNLPEKDDHSPFDKNSLRQSEFKVSLSAAPDFTITVTVDGESRILDSKYYNIEYSTETEFDSYDWLGNASSKWNSDMTNARSVRVSIIDAEGTAIPQDSTVSVIFNCTVDGEAQPGMTAWNSFGYHYSILGTNVELEAMPLTVGVKIPDVPALQKKLVDLNGKEYSAASDATFSFRVYKGDKVDDTLPYKDYQLTVANGQSTSEKLKLLNSSDWTWENGEAYTVTEISQENNFKFGNWNNKVANSFTFTYNSDLSQTLSCTDIYKLWSITIVKTDSTDENKKLSGAEFALYSIDKADEISDDAYNNLDTQPSKSVEIKNEIWYLCQVKTTDENGRIQFSDISGEKCCVIETKAPDDYYIDTSSHIYYNTDVSQIMNITNRQMINLPNVGSTEKIIFFMVGVFLIILSGVLLYKNRFAIISRLKK